MLQHSTDAHEIELIKQSDLLRALKITSPTLGEWQQREDFPRPVLLNSRNKAYYIREVREWLEKRRTSVAAA
jgi:predicted DNA-binding transcriptional regulator AlpA